MNKIFLFVFFLLLSSCKRLDQKSLDKILEEDQKPFKQCREKGGIPRRHAGYLIEVQHSYAGCDFPCKGD